MPYPTNAVDKLIAKVEVNFGRDNAAKTIYAGGTSNTLTVDEQIVEWLNDTQREVCEHQHFWFSHASTSLTLASGTDTIALPSDFMDEDAVWVYDSDTDSYKDLDFMSIEDMRRLYGDTTSDDGSPEAYRLNGDNLIIKPVADDDYTIRLDYWKYLDDLASGGTANYLVEKWPHLLEAGATAKAFRSVEQAAMADYWENKFKEALNDLVRENARRILPDEITVKMRPDHYGTTLTKSKMRRR